jgi:photosystem II stability/assembly factor-like uncharacterized protein
MLRVGRLVQAALWATLIAGSACAQPAFQAPGSVAAVKSALAALAPLNAVAMAGSRIVAAGQRGHVLYSDDGTTWTQAAVPSSADLTALSFPSARQGWAVGHEGVILHTADGGASWTRQLDGKKVAELAHGADKPFLDVWFEDDKAGWAIGAFNLILRTEDGGGTWTPWLDRADNPKELHLYAMRPGAGTLWIVGEQGAVLRLDRERQRFVNVPLPYKGTLFGVVGTPRMVLVFGLRGNAWRTIDSGASWTKVETGVAAGLGGGIVRADGSVVLVSQAGHVLLSTDEGATFSRVAPATAAPAFAVTEVRSGTVAVAGIGGMRIETVKAASGS